MYSTTDQKTHSVHSQNYLIKMINPEELPNEQKIYLDNLSNPCGRLKNTMYRCNGFKFHIVLQIRLYSLNYKTSPDLVLNIEERKTTSSQFSTVCIYKYSERKLTNNYSNFTLSQVLLLLIRYSSLVLLPWLLDNK